MSRQLLHVQSKFDPREQPEDYRELPFSSRKGDCRRHPAALQAMLSQWVQPVA